MINYYLNLVHLPTVPWLSTPSGATATIVLVATWQQLGFTFILFVAALAAVPIEVVEAASMDGVSPFRMFFNIKLPLISPTVLFASVVALINSMQLFDQPFIMTKGGPGDATRRRSCSSTRARSRTAVRLRVGNLGRPVRPAADRHRIQFLVSRKWVFYS